MSILASFSRKTVARSQPLVLIAGPRGGGKRSVLNYITRLNVHHRAVPPGSVFDKQGLRLGFMVLDVDAKEAKELPPASLALFAQSFAIVFVVDASWPEAEAHAARACLVALASAALLSDKPLCILGTRSDSPAATDARGLGAALGAPRSVAAASSLLVLTGSTIARRDRAFDLVLDFLHEKIGEQYTLLETMALAHRASEESSRPPSRGGSMRRMPAGMASALKGASRRALSPEDAGRRMPSRNPSMRSRAPRPASPRPLSVSPAGPASPPGTAPPRPAGPRRLRHVAVRTGAPDGPRAPADPRERRRAGRAPGPAFAAAAAGRMRGGPPAHAGPLNAEAAPDAAEAGAGAAASPARGADPPAGRRPPGRGGWRRRTRRASPAPWCPRADGGGAGAARSGSFKSARGQNPASSQGLRPLLRDLSRGHSLASGSRSFSGPRARRVGAAAASSPSTARARLDLLALATDAARSSSPATRRAGSQLDAPAGPAAAAGTASPARRASSPLDRPGASASAAAAAGGAGSPARRASSPAEGTRAVSPARPRRLRGGPIRASLGPYSSAPPAAPAAPAPAPSKARPAFASAPSSPAEVVDLGDARVRLRFGGSGGVQAFVERQGTPSKAVLVPIAAGPHGTPRMLLKEDPPPSRSPKSPTLAPLAAPAAALAPVSPVLAPAAAPGPSLAAGAASPRRLQPLPARPTPEALLLAWSRCRAARATAFRVLGRRTALLQWRAAIALQSFWRGVQVRRAVRIAYPDFADRLWLAKQGARRRALAARLVLRSRGGAVSLAAPPAPGLAAPLA
eukprot:tig00000204_g17735.t1